MSNLLTWTELRPAGDVDKAWNTVALSKNAQTILVGVYDGRLYLTANKGVSWAEVRPSGSDADKYWSASCVSDDGTVMLAGQEGPTGLLYVSTNSGTSWAVAYPFVFGGKYAYNWNCCRINSNGVIVAAAQGPVGNSGLVMSSDSGANWTDLHAENWYDWRGWRSVAITDDGQTIIACHSPYEFYVYISADGGVTWNASSSMGVDYRDKRVDVSGDGKVLAVAENGARLWTSIDIGTTWTEMRPAGDAPGGWRGLTVSKKGWNMICGSDVVVGDWGRIHISFDKGASWNEEKPGTTWIYGWKALSQTGDYWCIGNTQGRLWLSSKLSAPPVIDSFPWLGRFQLSHVTT